MFRNSYAVGLMVDFEIVAYAVVQVRPARDRYGVADGYTLYDWNGQPIGYSYAETEKDLMSDCRHWASESHRAALLA